MKLYADALTKGWRLTSKYPWLWFLGLFALLLSSNGGEFDFYLRNVDRLTTLPQVQTGVQNFIQIYSGQWILLSVLGIVLILALGVIIYFSLVSQNTIIHSASKPITEKLTFLESLAAGQKKVFSTFIINLFSKLSIFAFSILLMIPYFSYQNKIYLVVSLVILIPVVLIISFISKYAVSYSIIHEDKWYLAIKKAFVLFKKNWGVSLEMAGIIFLASFLVSIFVLICTGVMLAPALMPALNSAYSSGFTDDPFNVFFVGIILLLTLMALTAAIFASWQWASWTYLFQDLVDEPRESQIASVFNK